MGRFSQIFGELKRRNVHRAGAAYLVLAWVIVQVADIILDAFIAPTWVIQFIVIALAAGLPVTLVLSWVYEITTSGVKRTEDVSLEESITYVIGRKLDFTIIGFLVAALSISLYVNFRPASNPSEIPDPVSILIADFANETGNDLYTGVLEDTLRVGVEVARFVETMSRADARRTAQSIGGKPTETLGLNLDMASLVAIRQGVDIVVGGSISQDEDGITVEVFGINPITQAQIFSIAETTIDENEILSSVASIANRLREELGDEELSGHSSNPEPILVSNLAAASEFVHAQDLEVSLNLEEAIHHYSNAIELDPDLTRAYIGRALSRHYLGMSSQAASDWDVILARLDTLTERSRLRTLGNYYLTISQDYEKALETLERLIERYPADSVGQNNLAVAAFYNLDFDKARAAGRNVADRYPNRSGYKSNLALYTMYASDFDEANDLAGEAVLQDSQNVAAWLVLALSESMNGNHPNAVNAYLQMKDTGHHGSSIAFEGLADLEIYKGNYQAAIDILDDGVAADRSQNTNESAAIKYTMLAESYIRLGDWNAALTQIENAIEFGSRDASVVESALLLTDIGELEHADSIAVDMADNLSNFRRAYANIIQARIAQAKNDPLRAIDLLKSAIKLADLWLARFTLGNVYLDSGHFVEAYEEFQVCEERIGEGLSVYLNDRPTFRMLGKLESAIAATNSSLRASLDHVMGTSLSQ